MINKSQLVSSPLRSNQVLHFTRARSPSVVSRALASELSLDRRLRLLSWNICSAFEVHSTELEKITLTKMPTLPHYEEHDPSNEKVVDLLDKFLAGEFVTLVTIASRTRR